MRCAIVVSAWILLSVPAGMVVGWYLKKVQPK